MKDLQKIYGIEFPKDVELLWELACKIEPTNPTAAFKETLDISLVGPFDILAGSFDKLKPKLSMYLHYRYFLDPPEFFTVLHGGIDGLHWGFWFDDPNKLPPRMCSYYRNDAYSLRNCAPGLIASVIEHLNEQRKGILENIKYDSKHKAEYQEDLAELEILRPKLENLIQRLPMSEVVKRNVPSRWGMGFFVPQNNYAPMEIPESDVLKLLESGKNISKLVNRVERDCKNGNYGLGLQVGHLLWAYSNKSTQAAGTKLLALAYKQLKRTILSEVLNIHSANRGLKSVDLTGIS